MSTVRERLERIRALVGRELARDTVANIVVLHRIHEDAVAALATLDEAEIQLPMFVATGMGDIEFIDDVYTPDGAAIYRAAKRHRLVPDPLVPRLDANPNTKEDA